MVLNAVREQVDLRKLHQVRLVGALRSDHLHLDLRALRLPAALGSELLLGLMQGVERIAPRLRQKRRGLLQLRKADALARVEHEHLPDEAHHLRARRNQLRVELDLLLPDDLRDARGGARVPELERELPLDQVEEQHAEREHVALLVVILSGHDLRSRVEVRPAVRIDEVARLHVPRQPKVTDLYLAPRFVRNIETAHRWGGEECETAHIRGEECKRADTGGEECNPQLGR